MVVHGCSQDLSGVRFSPCNVATKKAFFDRFPGANEAILIMFQMFANATIKWIRYFMVTTARRSERHRPPVR